MEGIDMEQGLARWPRGGNRRRLEDSWLRELERRGLPSHLPDPPAGASTALQQAIVEFNSGAFWECHETLEEIWLETAYPLRFFYHAIIKVAVGFHHTSRRNRHGARVKLSDGCGCYACSFPASLVYGQTTCLERPQYGLRAWTAVSAWTGRNSTVWPGRPFKLRSVRAMGLASASASWAPRRSRRPWPP